MVLSLFLLLPLGRATSATPVNGGGEPGDILGLASGSLTPEERTMYASQPAAAPSVIALLGPKDFVDSDGYPLPTGFQSGASITSAAPFGMAIRSGIPSSTSQTGAGLSAELTPGVTVESVSFSYRQVTGYATTGQGPTFALTIAGATAWTSPALHGFPYSKSCPDGGCYSPAANVSASSLSIRVPSDGVHRLAFEFNNTMMNLQLLLPMTLALTCSGGPCTTAKPPAPAPNASAVNIACVGDSITQGYLSTNGADYPHQLQTMLGSDYKVRRCTLFFSRGKIQSRRGVPPVRYHSLT